MNEPEHSIGKPGARVGAPPGWQFNPSSWSKRLVSVTLACAGFAVATYLALYQVRVIRNVWEPFFGNGSDLVLHSSLSRLLPLPDAALGGFGYALEIVTAVIGGRQRWRTLPLMAVIFGSVAAGMALVSAILIVCQPLLAHAWCTLCLCSSAISFVIVGPAVSELRAALQNLRTQRSRPKASPLQEKAFLNP